MKFDSIAPYMLILISAIVLSSCYHLEDPGPIQEVERTYAVADFDRLETGNAFNIEVTYGDYFDVSVRGDRRNVDDLVVRREGTTLVIRFDDQRDRKHETYITIKMPLLRSANFSGASDSRISGFDDLQHLDLYLSGASVCNVDVEASDVDVVLSGASYMNLRGIGELLDAKLSGASVLKASGFPVTRVDISASGASDGHVTVSNALNAVASGASVITFRGDPVVVHSEASGNSTIRPE
jgi:hypothetical protein